MTLLGPASPDRPARIVSLVPSLTEWLAALGLDRETVGLTRFCVHPEGWKARKAIVGGTKTVDVAKVLALGPDLVIASREENVREPVEALAAAGVAVALTDIATVDGALDAMAGIARLTDRAAEGDRIVGDIRGHFAALPSRPARRVLYLIWRDPWMAVGGDTYISDVLARGGFENVTADRDRYPTLADADFSALRPDAVLLSSEPYPFGDAHRAEVEAIVPNARVVLVDGEAFSWYGPRMDRAPAALRALHALLDAPLAEGARDT